MLQLSKSISQHQHQISILKWGRGLYSVQRSTFGLVGFRQYYFDIQNLAF